MGRFSDSERAEFFKLYKKDKKALSVLFTIAIAAIGILFAAGAVQSFFKKDFVNAALAAAFGIIAALAINAFKNKVLYKPLNDVFKNRYRLYRECVIDKNKKKVEFISPHEARFRIGATSYTSWCVSSTAHKNAEAISAENWADIQLGDIV